MHFPSPVLDRREVFSEYYIPFGIVESHSTLSDQCLALSHNLTVTIFTVPINNGHPPTITLWITSRQDDFQVKYLQKLQVQQQLTLSRGFRSVFVSHGIQLLYLPAN